MLLTRNHPLARITAAAEAHADASIGLLPGEVIPRSAYTAWYAAFDAEFERLRWDTIAAHPVPTARHDIGRLFDLIDGDLPPAPAGVREITDLHAAPI